MYPIFPLARSYAPFLSTVGRRRSSLRAATRPKMPVGSWGGSEQASRLASDHPLSAPIRPEIPTPVLRRLPLVLCLVQALIMYAPPLGWTMWMVHFSAVELCFVGVGLGVLALAVNRERLARGLAVLGLFACAIPPLAITPVYLQQQAPFSPVAWLTGGSVPEIPVEHDVALGPLTADIWRGVGEGPRGAVVVVHGGSWRAGDKGEVPHVSAALAEAGFTVFDLRYRLAPDAPFPAAIEDVRCALATIAAQSSALGVDPSRVVLLGRSAGAQIVLVSAYADDSIPSACGGDPVPVRGVVSIYGPTDLAWAHANPYVPDVVDGVSAIETYLGGPPAGNEARYRAATPQSWARRDLPPTLLIHGTGERCVRPENAEKLEAALRTVNAPVTLLRVPFAEHGFDVRRGGLGEQLTRAAILRFVREL